MYPPASGPKYAPVRFRLVALLLAVSLFTLSIPHGFIQIIPTAEAAPSPNVVISQVYGAGGNVGATLKNDYIELFNRGTSTVNLSGWSVQYASATGTGNFSGNVTNLSGSLAPGQYYLVQESGGSVGAALPTPDVSTGTIAMAAGAGKVIVANTTTGLACNGSSTLCSAAQLAQIVDLVGYGNANFFEGAGTAPTIDATHANFRAGSGCTDTDVNSADFASAAPAPRNTSSATHPCNITNNPPTITAPPNPAATVAQNAAPFNVSLTGNDDGGVYTWGATVGTGVASVIVASGQSTANVTYQVTLVSNFNGTATFTATLSDGVNTPSTTRAVNIQVNPPVVVNNPPIITAPANPITSTTRDAVPFTVSLQGSDDGGVYNWSATVGTGVSSVVVSGGQGSSNVTYTVTLASGFTGTATFTATLSDNVNTPATQQAVNINVTPPPALDHIVISQVYGGGGNSGATYQNDYVELYNPTAAPVDVSGWSIQYGSATGSTWQTQPIGGPIQPGEYYLISLASGGAVGAALPAANIVGEINMSGTAGKVALSSSGTALSGCPAVGGVVVDFVGYGTTANCREGGANAPAPSNTTAIFRKNGGFTDTNVNGSDFQTGAPNPRRTAVITELGPWVSSTDPGSNFTNIPHDATVQVSFSEPVDAVGAWYNINCTVTGSHNDATVSHTTDYKTWAFTPNANFQFGEKCTLTVAKDAIHDRDTDDSGLNTDTLFADYTSSFTVVAAGAPAPYPPGVHLTMGNPSNAAADVNQPNNYLMEKEAFTLSYNRDKGTPNWVSWHLEPAWYGNLARNDTFRADPAVPADWYRVQSFDYGFSGFDRGHMTPNADRDNENAVRLNQATFLMSNMVPQAPDNNQGPWAAMESALRTIADAGNELYVVSGPAGVGGTGSSGFASTIAGGHVTVPAQTWKVVLVLPKQSGDDVARVTCATQTIAVIMPNTQGIRNDDWHNYITTVDAVETLTGYNLFSNLPDDIETCVEAGTNGINPPGVADGAYTTAEDAPANVTLTAYPSSTATLTYNVLNAPAHGTLSGTGADRVYTPVPDFNGTDSFTFSVTDGTRTSRIANVSLLVNEVNDAPTANDDGGKTTQEDTALSFPAGDLTSNDSAGPADESGQTLTVTSVSGGADTHGAVSLAAGQVTYTPALNYHGPASFTYQVCDNGTTAGNPDAKCDDASVSVTVESVNDAPAAVDDSATTDEDTPVSINVRANDSDVDGDALSVSAVTQGAHGSITDNGDGTVTYTPAANYNGPDAFTYTVSDGNGAQASAGVNVNVNAVNDAPTANDDAATTAEDTPVNVNVAGNDTDVDGDAPAVTAVTAPSHGTAVIEGGGVKYSPAADYDGADSFTYTISDGHGGTATATVSMTVSAVNDAPSASDDAAETDEDTPVSFNVTVNDADVDGDGLAVTAVTQPAHGTAAFAGGSVTYTPTLNYNGTDSFTYTVGDGHGGSATAAVGVTVRPVNDNPVAVNDSATVAEDSGANTVSVLGNDSDVDDATLSVSAVTQGAYGSVANNGSSVSYTPAADYNGSDTFTYTTSDGHGGTSTATVSVNVTAVNDNPVANADTATTDEDMPVTVDVVSGDTDVDGDTLTLQSVDGATHGSVAVVDGKAVFTPASNYNGPASFTYTVSDGHGGTASTGVSVTVNPVNDAPAAGNDSANTDEDTAVTVNVVSNDTDVENDTLTVTAVGTPSHGTTVIVGNQVKYTPASNYNGSDSFSYTVSDGHGGTANATVSVNVASVNDAPSLSNVPATATIPELSAYTFTAQASDVDGQTLTFSLVGAPAGAAINPSTGQFNWTPTEAQGGTGSPYVFKVRVSDGVTNTDSDVSLTVTEVNSAPTLAHIGDRVVLLGGTLTFTASGADADVPAQTLTYSLTGAYPAGATINPTTGVFNWTPTAAQAGHVYTFGVRVTDNGAGQLHADETLNVGTGYTWSGVLQPINQDDSSIFKLGRTVPVKFQLTAASAGVTNAVARLYVAKVTDSVVGTEEEADSTSNATDGNLFRYSGGQYIFNLSTDGLTVGTYQLRVDMGDGVLRVVNISLR